MHVTGHASQDAVDRAEGIRIQNLQIGHRALPVGAQIPFGTPGPFRKNGQQPDRHLAVTHAGAASLAAECFAQ
jgi:hypothetical protein